MIELFDVTVFSVLTGILLCALILFTRNQNQTSPQKLSRDPLKIKTAKKQGFEKLSYAIDSWLTLVLRRGNIQLDRVAALLTIVCSGLLVAAATFVFELPIAFQVSLSLLTLFVGFAVYYLIMWNRIRKFNSQFPAGLELMARATRAGESIESSFAICQKSCEQPLKGELQYCHRQLELGLSVDVVTKDLANRIGSVDLKLFAHMISIHDHVGGALATSLERLSTVIRKRSECLEKIKSATGIGRFAVLAIVGMGILVFVYLMTMEPDYIGKLYQSNLGKNLVTYAIVSETIGLAWVAWTLKSEP